MNRRRFIQSAALSSLFVSSAHGLSALSRPLPDQPDQGSGTALEVDVLFDTARKLNWKDLSIGEIMARAGMTLINTPYVGGTLESDGPEQCRINLRGLDCVTFFENMLAFARCVKLNESGMDVMLDQIRYTRYRQGKLDGYISRLHYTAEWISDNVAKGVVANITTSLDHAAIPFNLHVDFMSLHPQYYEPLRREPALISRIAAIEGRINAMKHWFVPKDGVQGIEHLLQSGDIIAIATSKSGLDYAHTGMIRRDEEGKAHFLHASLSKKRVTYDAPISEYLKTVPSHIGITVARPLDPSSSKP